MTGMFKIAFTDNARGRTEFWEWFFSSKCWEASVENCEGSGRPSTGHTDSKRGAKSSQNSKNTKYCFKGHWQVGLLVCNMPVNTDSGLKMWRSPRSLCSATHYELGLLQYLANSTWLWSPPSLLVNCPFLRMKSLLRGHHFQVVPKTKQRLMTMLHTIPKSQLQQCVQQWQKCLSRCINSERDHLKADNKDQQQRWVYIALSTQSGNFWICPFIKTLKKKKYAILMGWQHSQNM